MAERTAFTAEHFGLGHAGRNIRVSQDSSNEVRRLVNLSILAAVRRSLIPVFTMGVFCLPDHLRTQHWFLKVFPGTL